MHTYIKINRFVIRIYSYIWLTYNADFIPINALSIVHHRTHSTLRRCKKNLHNKSHERAAQQQPYIDKLLRKNFSLCVCKKKKKSKVYMQSNMRSGIAIKKWLINKLKTPIMDY